MLRTSLRFTLFVSCISLIHQAVHAQCNEWSTEFAANGLTGAAAAFAVYDDGSGPALYVGGMFLDAGGVQSPLVARWDGTTWSTVGSGLTGIDVRALAVFDDGTGRALYAAGSFDSGGGVLTTSLVRFDGTDWRPVVSGAATGISALCVFDDGNGARLYAGGVFATIGGTSVHFIASYDGTSWHDVGGGTDLPVRSLAVFDDGTGSALYAGGQFTQAGGVRASRIARWNGVSWSALDRGVNGNADALCIYDDGSGPALYVGGAFGSAGGSPASAIAKWNGTSWSALGSGLGGVAIPLVGALATYDDGNGEQLYVGGFFKSAGGVLASHLARWDGSTWSAAASRLNGAVNALARFDDGEGGALFMGGSFSAVDQVAARRVARLHGGAWTAVGGGQGLLQGAARTLAVVDDGGGEKQLYAGGTMFRAGDEIVRGIARWSGSAWEAVAPGVPGFVNAITEFDDGSGPALYVGGSVIAIGKEAALNVAKWSGDEWTPIGSGPNGQVHALAVFGDALYAGGTFFHNGAGSANHISKWDGTTWSALAQGTNATVRALCVFDDGSGPALYIGGDFTSVDGNPINGIARWDGSAWGAVGGGTSVGVHALCVFDDGSGPALFAGGAFLAAGGNPANRVAKWDGTTWSALGVGVGDTVHTLSAFDDGTGSGTSLYVGGRFDEAGGATARLLARWNGFAWQEVGGGLTGACCVDALAAFDDDGVNGADLFVGGSFTHAGTTASAGIARLRGCGAPGIPFCFGQGTIVPCPCGNSGMVGHGCDNSNGTGGARFEATGWPSVTSDSLKLAVSGTGTFAACLFVQSTDAGLPLHSADGISCISGSVVRLFTKHASLGMASAPGPLDRTISERSADAGDPLRAASTRTYQVVYRDSSSTFCPEPLGGFRNTSNALRVTWSP